MVTTDASAARARNGSRAWIRAAATAHASSRCSASDCVAIWKTCWQSVVAAHNSKWSTPSVGSNHVEQGGDERFNLRRRQRVRQCREQWLHSSLEVGERRLSGARGAEVSNLDGHRQTVDVHRQDLEVRTIVVEDEAERATGGLAGPGRMPPDRRDCQTAA